MVTSIVFALFTREETR